MNPALALCEHLSSPNLRSLRVDPADILDWNDGPVLAIARCAECGALGLMERIDPSHFALSAMEPASFAALQRATGKGSCDLTRAQKERDAFLASAGPVERTVTLDPP